VGRYLIQESGDNVRCFIAFVYKHTHDAVAHVPGVQGWVFDGADKISTEANLPEETKRATFEV
jgi:hypothetical protein